MKDRTRTDEVRILMQGLNISTTEMCAIDPVQPSKDRPSTAPTTFDPVVILQPQDRTGSASVRVRRPAVPPVVPSTSFEPPVLPNSENMDEQYEFQQQTDNEKDGPLLHRVTPPQQVIKTIPRSTASQQRKREADAAAKGLVLEAKKPRKEYTCRKCGKGISSPGHTQYRGYGRFCQEFDGKDSVTPSQWVAEKRELEAQKKALD